jgi:transposase-like protein
MDVHKNARLTPKGREEMVRAVVEGGVSKAATARRFNTTAKTVAKWVDRFRRDGIEGLRDCSSRPHSSPAQTPQAACAAIEAWRRQRRTGKQIAAELGIPPATVSRVLRRLGLNKLAALEPGDARGCSNTTMAASPTSRRSTTTSTSTSRDRCFRSQPESAPNSTFIRSWISQTPTLCRSPIRD